jgi:uncharacterized membrane protein YdfJ with MMPL/SSD domain
MVSACPALGRFSVRSRYPVVLLWLAGAVAATQLLPSPSSAVDNDNAAFLPADSPSVRAVALAAPLQRADQLPVTIVAGRSGAPFGPTDQAAVDRAVAAVQRAPGVAVPAPVLARVGESISFSAGTVVAGVLCLLPASFGFYEGLAYPLAIGISLMLLAGLTLLHALPAIAGGASFWPSNVRPGPPRIGLWSRVAAPRLTALHAVLGPAQRLPPTPPARLGSIGVTPADYQADRASAQFVSPDGHTVQWRRSAWRCWCSSTSGARTGSPSSCRS